MKLRLDTSGNVVALVRATHIHALTVLARAHTGRPAAMEIIGLDLHKRETQLCRQRPDGRIVDERIPTSRARFTASFGGLAPARILLEASTESEWVATHLERWRCSTT